MQYYLQFMNDTASVAVHMKTLCIILKLIIFLVTMMFDLLKRIACKKYMITQLIN